MHLPILLFLLVTVTLIGCSANNDTSEFRTWTDVQGRTMEAKLIHVDKDTNEVVFVKDTGRRYRFLVNQLSEADQKYIDSQKDMLPDPIVVAAIQRTEFEKKLGKDLIQFSGGRVKEIGESDLSAKDYYAIYYSAHWCPPCRKFTPQLVSFYNSYSKRFDNFEIIFVSSDRNEDEMKNYMKSANMPWLALDFGKKQTSHPATRYSGNGIPCLVLLDNKGNVLADSYVGNRYIGPASVMDALKKKLDHR